MNTHWIKIFDGTNNNYIVEAVPHYLKLDFLPAENALFKQNLMHWAGVQTFKCDRLKLFLIIGDTTAGASKGKGGTDNNRETNLISNFTHIRELARNA